MTSLNFPNPLDQVTLVNDSDEVIGQMDKIDAHRGQGKLHRAISVYLFRSKYSLRSLEGRTSSPADAGHDKWGEEVELLIQQRSSKKIVGAHQWANTVCGNVRPNETYEQCAYRRLKEELGIDFFSPPMEGRTSNSALAESDKRSGSDRNSPLTPLYKFQYHLQCNEKFSEWEIDQVFVGWYDGPVTPNPDEVQDYEWIDINQVKSVMEKGKKGKYGEIELPLTLSTQHFSHTTHNSQLKPEARNLKPSVILAPWFVYMLEDQELQQKLKQFAGF